MKTIGVLALQGAVSEHLIQLERLSVKAIPVKQPQDFEQLDGLIIPGGESTAISRLMKENQLIEPIKLLAQQGKGIFGTCAGLILCGTSTTHSAQTDRDVIPLQLIDIKVERNGFGRQIDSFETKLTIKHIGEHIPAVFIRAPYIQEVGKNVEVLAKVNDHIIMAQQDNILVAAFHPELTHDYRVMQYFLTLCH